MNTSRKPRRVDVFYRCAGCGLERRGAPGKMFCDECGGPLRSVGYAGKLADLPTIHDDRRRRA